MEDGIFSHVLLSSEKFVILGFKDQSCDDEWVEKTDSKDNEKESYATGRAESMDQETEEVYKMHDKVSQT